MPNQHTGGWYRNRDHSFTLRFEIPNDVTATDSAMQANQLQGCENDLNASVGTERQEQPLQIDGKSVAIIGFQDGVNRARRGGALTRRADDRRLQRRRSNLAQHFSGPAFIERLIDQAATVQATKIGFGAPALDFPDRKLFRIMNVWVGLEPVEWRQAIPCEPRPGKR